ncbi:transcriptional regulator [Kineococcus sp. NPDC059986]|uniref:transcriptional regulator n=1 Tax=Kineococcus sp. NPDC059986 TaxID=3155538 RepID=UPI00344EDB64
MTTTTGGGTPGTDPGLDDVFSNTVRLRLCAYLSGCEEADFQAVQDYCGLTQPTLSKNVTVLADRGYVAVAKVASGRYTRTRLRLTDDGRVALDGHVAALQAIVGQARAQHDA